MNKKNNVIRRIVLPALITGVISLAGSGAPVFAAKGGPEPTEQARTVMRIAGALRDTLYSFGGMARWSMILPPVVNGAALASALVSAQTPGPQTDPVLTGSVGPGVFGTIAIPFRNLAARPKWARATAGMDGKLTNCPKGRDCRAMSGRVDAFVKQSHDMDFYARLSAANRLVNESIAYRSDAKIYGELDHWAQPGETLSKGAGDCEDFALLKMGLLRKAGVPMKSMSLVVLRDKGRNLYHAVLTVSTNKGVFVLDNVRNEVLPDVRLKHYQALYSISDNRFWIHGVRRGEGVAVSKNDGSLQLAAIAPGESVPDNSISTTISDSWLSDLRPAFGD